MTADKAKARATFACNSLASLAGPLPVLMALSQHQDVGALLRKMTPLVLDALSAIEALEILAAVEPTMTRDDLHAAIERLDAAITRLAAATTAAWSTNSQRATVVYERAIYAEAAARGDVAAHMMSVIDLPAVTVAVTKQATAVRLHADSRAACSTIQVIRGDNESLAQVIDRAMAAAPKVWSLVNEE